MEWLMIVGVVVVAGWLWLNSKAKGIARRHAGTLSQRTGMSVDRIYREMKNGSLTPGEWASKHGLDPISFEPRRPSEEVRRQAQRELDRIWQRLRLDRSADSPDGETLNRIGELHSELARNLLEPAPMLTEIKRRNAIAVELHELGSRIDAEWLNSTIDQAREELDRSRYSEDSVLGRPQTQDEFDDWQRKQVDRARSETSRKGDQSI